MSLIEKLFNRLYEIGAVEGTGSFRNISPFGRHATLCAALLSNDVTWSD